MKPHPLLDVIKEKKNIKRDAQLARKLEISTPTISKVRNKKLPCGATLIIKAHEYSGISIKELKELAESSREE